MKTVIVNRRTTYKKNGMMQLVATEEKILPVVAEYMGGKVRVASGDVWKVKKYDGGKADYIVSEPVG